MRICKETRNVRLKVITMKISIIYYESNYKSMHFYVIFVKVKNLKKNILVIFYYRSRLLFQNLKISICINQSCFYSPINDKNIGVCINYLIFTFFLFLFIIERFRFANKMILQRFVKSRVSTQYLAQFRVAFAKKMVACLFLRTILVLLRGFECTCKCKQRWNEVFIDRRSSSGKSRGF